MKKMIVIVVSLSMLLSGMLVAVGGEAEEDDKTVLDEWDDYEVQRHVYRIDGDLIDRHILTYSYDMESDELPENMAFYINGYSERYERRIIEIERPDSDELVDHYPFIGTYGRLELESLYRGGRVGEFDENINLNRSMRIRENLWEDARYYLRVNQDEYEGDYENLTIQDFWDLNPCDVIFSEANENWLSGDPDPLKGEYKITIMLEGTDLEVDEDNTLITIWDGGEEEDDEEDIIDRIRDIPGFKSTLLLLGAVIALAVYRKKDKRP